VAEGDGAFLFVRHGETDYNRRGLRCGGDVDIPLTDHGKRQAAAAGVALRPYAGRVDVIIAAPLQRTQMTARLIAPALGDPPIILHPGLVERLLGGWNGAAVETTQPLIDRGESPPGGETELSFRARIASMLGSIVAGNYRLPLLVGSKGVARMTRLVLQGVASVPLGNGEFIYFPVPKETASRLGVPASKSLNLL
jgi:probable phosphoglycerate mutase